LQKETKLPCSKTIAIYEHYYQNHKIMFGKIFRCRRVYFYVHFYERSFLAILEREYPYGKGEIIIDKEKHFNGDNIRKKSKQYRKKATLLIILVRHFLINATYKDNMLKFSILAYATSFSIILENNK